MQDLDALFKTLTSGNDDQAEAAAQKLNNFGDVAYQNLVDLLNSTDADTRWWAVRALANFTEQNVADHLISALDDPDLSVQQCAALALCQNPTNQAINALIKAINSHDPILARLAGEALTSIGESAVLPLIEVLENSSQSARLVAARALAMISDPRAIPALYAILGEDSALLDYWANEGLDRMETGMVYFNP
jgi:bilin biosynthesis protein